MDELVPPRSLKALAEAEAHCTRCPLYRNATQVVPGEGSPRSRLMMVGEQPGKQEADAVCCGLVHRRRHDLRQQLLSAGC